MKNPHASRLVGCLLLALAVLVSSWVLRGTPASGWVETALTGAALSFFVLRPACAPRPR